MGHPDPGYLIPHLRPSLFFFVSRRLLDPVSMVPGVWGHVGVGRSVSKPVSLVSGSRSRVF